MKTVREQWEEFREKTIPKKAHPIQIVEMMRGFYGGMAAMLFTMTELTNENLSDDEAAERLDLYQQELIAYANSIIYTEEPNMN